MTDWKDFKTKLYVKTIEDIKEPNVIGFVYKITNLKSGKFYIGKKELFHRRKTLISKREKTQTLTRKKFKQIIKESNWKDYYGSSKELLEDINTIGKQKFKREILEFSFSKKHLSYLEVKYQFLFNVLENDTYNGNILGKFFSSDLKPKCK